VCITFCLAAHLFVTIWSKHSSAKGENTSKANMSGKWGKGLGKGGAKHHRKVLRENILSALTNGASRRLARRGGGVKRISDTCYDETGDALKKYLKGVIADCLCLAEHDRNLAITGKYGKWRIYNLCDGHKNFSHRLSPMTCHVQSQWL
jgi:histone H4